MSSISGDDLRAEVTDWLASSWNAATPSRDWLAAVVDAGWAVPRWPVEWFGRGLSDADARIVEAEFKRVGAPGSGQDRTNLWANTLLACGTEALKHELIGPLLKSQIGMCLLYSEPGAGSDLAGIRTRAEPDGDTFIVNGQKVWTSYAASADYGMLIARTDWDVPKHKGISFFFLPMKQPGVEVQPLRQITGEAQFNEVFLTDAVVPAENVLGGLGGGWGVLQTALAYERSVMGDAARGGRSGADAMISEEPLIALAWECGCLTDPVIRQEIAKAVALKKLNALNTARAKADLAQGTSSSIMSLGKLAMSRILHEEARVRTLILGAAGLLEGPEHPQAGRRQLPDSERLFHLYRRRDRSDPAQHHRRACAGPAA